MQEDPAPDAQSVFVYPARLHFDTAFNDFRQRLHFGGVFHVCLNFNFGESHD